MRLWTALAIATAVAIATPAAAQARLTVSIAVSPNARTTEGPSVFVENPFNDARSVELLASGFPASVAITTELWVHRTLFDDLVGSRTTTRIVRYDALAKVYRVGRLVADDSVAEEGRYTTLAEVSRALATPVRVPLTAPSGRRGMYYVASVTIETFNSNDLLEVQRWLNGDVEPAIRGKRNPVSAVTRGLATLFSRLLGGDVKRAQARSEVFDT